MTAPTITCTVNVTGHQWHNGSCLFCAEPAPTVPLLTDEQRAEIRGREAAATKGPWGVVEDRESLTRWVSSEDGMLDISFGYVGNCTQDDAAFVAHARTDVPALLAHLAAEERESAHQRAERVRQATEVGLVRSALAEINKVLASRGEGPTGDALLGRIAGIVRRVEAAGGAS